MNERVAVVLAGGLGTRIASVADGKPKVLLDVGGRPFIDRKLEELARNDVSAAVLLLGYGSEQVTAWLNENPCRIAVASVVDGPSLRGTGGALLDCLPLLPETFFLTYGDSLLTLDYADLEARVLGDGKGRSCLAVVRPQESMDARRNTAVRNGIVVAHSKANQTHDMAWLDYGLSFMSKSDLQESALAERPADLSLLYESLCRRERLLAFETQESYLEIGTPDSLAHVSRAVN